MKPVNPNISTDTGKASVTVGKEYSSKILILSSLQQIGKTYPAVSWISFHPSE